MQDCSISSALAMEIYRIMHELPWITSQEWITSHEWKSFANHITSDKKSLLRDFLHVILCPEYTIPLKESPITHFAIVTKDGLFWLSIATSSQLICDVTRTRDTSIVTSYSGDCSSTHKLAKRRFSPINYKDEYRFLITRCKKLQSCTIPSIPYLDTFPQYIRHNLRAKREIYYTLQLPKNANTTSWRVSKTKLLSAGQSNPSCSVRHSLKIT